MKRRAFLATAAILSLFSSAPANAAKKATTKTSTKKPVAKAKTTSRRKVTAKKSANKPAPQEVVPAAAVEPQSETRNVISLPDEPLAKWRTYDIRSSIKLNRVNGKARLWLPLAQYKGHALGALTGPQLAREL